MSVWHQRFWGADGTDRGYRALAVALAPMEWAYRLGVHARNWAFDHGVLRSELGEIPTLAVGNLTVGGTGKTPISSWFAGALLDRGIRTAVVTRGYGRDEVEVHRLLNPSVSVVVEADRVAAVRAARREGIEVAVLDDAFQHRYLKATASVVLIAVEDWMKTPRLLPRGPWREPLSALGRATLVVLTRKVASAEGATRVSENIASRLPMLPQARVRIELAGLARFDALHGLGATMPLSGFEAGLAVAGVARPELVFGQLEEAGVSLNERWGFPDHHRYGRAEIGRIRRVCGTVPLVATLKDAVKLGAPLGGDVPIYVPVQQIVWEAGASEIDGLLTRLEWKGKLGVP